MRLRQATLNPLTTSHVASHMWPGVLAGARPKLTFKGDISPPFVHFPLVFSMAAESVRVAIRARPLLSHELEAGACSIANKLSSTDLVLGSDRVFSYNHVFGADDEQEAIFDSAVSVPTAA